ncbi:hypothetical protein [Nostocoides vanveenii]|uniref:hypothetical protein n=1 Tax=Nostocoides vanveenii TaxID=330835 RepID=UPI0031E08AF2
MLKAGNVVATLPLIIFFLIAQKQFVATMTFSGLKGRPDGSCPLDAAGGQLRPKRRLRKPPPAS